MAAVFQYGGHLSRARNNNFPHMILVTVESNCILSSMLNSFMTLTTLSITNIETKKRRRKKTGKKTKKKKNQKILKNKKKKKKTKKN